MSDCSCPWEYFDTQELLRNTAPINMTKEERDQQEKFEFLKQAAIAIAGRATSATGWPVSSCVATAQALLTEVWQHKGKL